MPAGVGRVGVGVGKGGREGRGWEEPVLGWKGGCVRSGCGVKSPRATWKAASMCEVGAEAHRGDCTHLIKALPESNCMHMEKRI